MLSERALLRKNLGHWLSCYRPRLLTPTAAAPPAPTPSPGAATPQPAAAFASAAAALAAPPKVPAAGTEEALAAAGSMAQQLIPRPVALQGGAPQVSSPKRRRVGTGEEPRAAAASVTAMAAPSAAAARLRHPGREAARREWGPPQLAHVLPALYTRECSTAAEAAAIASGEPLPATPGPAKATKPVPPPRPNYFLALQVSHSPSVVAAIQRVQAAVCKHSPHLKKACVEAVSSHLTLGVMALQNGDDVARAEDALRQLGAVLGQQGLLAPLELSLGGLSHFSSQVLYLDVEEGKSLQQLLAVAQAVRSHFAQAGLLQDTHRDFTPHVTIAKLSKLPREAQGGGGGGSWRVGGRGGKGGRSGGQKGGGGGGGREKHWRGTYKALLDADDAERMAVAAAAAAAEDAEGGEEDTGPARVSDEMNVEGGARERGPGEGGEGPRPRQSAADCAVDEEEDGDGDAPASAMAGGKRARGKHSKCSGGDGGGGWNGKGIPPEAYVSLQDISGGSVVVSEVQLCRMMGRRTGEYYFVQAVAALLAEESPIAAAGNGAPPAPAEGAVAMEGDLPDPTKEEAMIVGGDAAEEELTSEAKEAAAAAKAASPAGEEPAPAAAEVGTEAL